MSRRTLKQRNLDYLRKEIGLDSWKALKRGGTLNIWRNTSPHNTWVEGVRGQMYWHSSGWIALPIKEFFNLVDEEGKVISYWGNDSGQPAHSIYKLKKQYLNKLTK